MAYTRTWSDITPADSDQASTLGLAIRNLRTDIEERMQTVTNNTWDQDPVGGPLTMSLNIPASMNTRAVDSDWSCDWNDPSVVRQGMQLQTGTSYLYVPIVLPQFVTITGLKMAGRVSAAGGSVIVQAISVGSMIGSMDTGTSIGSSSSPTANGTWQMMSCGTLSQVMSPGIILTAVIRGISGTRIVHYGGLEVTYTRPALWNTY